VVFDNVLWLRTEHSSLTVRNTFKITGSSIFFIQTKNIEHIHKNNVFPTYLKCRHVSVSSGLSLKMVPQSRVWVPGWLTGWFPVFTTWNWPSWNPLVSCYSTLSTVSSPRKSSLKIKHEVHIQLILILVVKQVATHKLFVWHINFVLTIQVLDIKSKLAHSKYICTQTLKGGKSMHIQLLETTLQ